jgi:DNA/RNA-binding domain of Phe-tRNA-synthetase-like protein
MDATWTLPADPHPILRTASFATEFPTPLGEMPSPAWLLDLLKLDAAAPLARAEDVRAAVRDVLRHHGYKPTGRGKPSSEYLLREAGAEGITPINLAVDCCNAVSLNSGLPISVVDADLATPPWRIAVAAEGASYVFNPSGQTIDLAGIPCLFDAAGPCANAVKDAQRTKPHAGTRRTVTVIWGAAGHEDRLERALAWYREILDRAGASTAPPGAAPGT